MAKWWFGTDDPPMPSVAQMAAWGRLPQQEERNVTISGIDLSDWQGDPDETRIAAAGKQFAILKVSEGTDWASRVFAKNWPEVKAAGMVRLAYHYAKPFESSGHDEAVFFLNTLATLGGPLLPGDGLALDLEDDDDRSADLLAYALDFKRTVEQAVGFPPLLYSRAEYMQRHNLTGKTAEHHELSDSGLWLASYGEVKPEAPEPWQFLAIWQRSSQDWVPGVAGPVDGDVFFGDADQLRRYGKPAPRAVVQ